MAKRIDTDFTAYELSDEENMSGSKLNLNQKMVVQNKLAQAAQDKLDLSYDETKPIESAQKEAYLLGVISTLRTILDESTLAESI